MCQSCFSTRVSGTPKNGDMFICREHAGCFWMKVPEGYLYHFGYIGENGTDEVGFVPYGVLSEDERRSMIYIGNCSNWGKNVSRS